MKANTDTLVKTLQVSNLTNGGLLPAESQDEFVQIIRGSAQLLGLVRFEKKTQRSGNIDKLRIGEPITQSATENAPALTLSEPKFDRVAYTALKTRSDWNITREAMLDNIEQERFDESVMEAMTARMKIDFEMLGIQGDVATFAAVNTPRGRLLRANDGWDLLTNNAHIVDASGAEIAAEMFTAASRQMPDERSEDEGVRWFISRKTLADYVDLYAGRATNAGDAAGMRGMIEEIFGFPITVVPLIPTNQALTVTEATAGATLGTQYGPFDIDATNQVMSISVDGGAATIVTLTVGNLEVVEVAGLINAAVAATIASDDGYGRLLLQSTTTGAASNITLNVVANDAYTTLGLAAGANAGTIAGVADTVNEGTFVWLVNPQNFIWIHVLETAVSSEYNQNLDRVEMVTYAFNDYIVEDLDAVVKLDNVRRRALV
jgi:hypothetical protein